MGALEASEVALEEDIVAVEALVVEAVAVEVIQGDFSDTAALALHKKRGGRSAVVFQENGNKEIL